MSRLSAANLCVSPPADPARGPGTPPLIRDFSLDVGAGEWVALGGANGCGKTTLLLALAGLWPARSGSLRFDGEPLGPGAPPGLRSRIAVVLQDPSSQLLQPTVREELAFTARNLGMEEEETAARVARWSGCFGLDQDLHRDPQTLSAGRQQLVLLAAALVPGPALLLADEPAAHLDPTARRTVLAAVREQVAGGLAALWVTQDATEREAARRHIHLGRPEEPLDLPRAGGTAPSTGDLLEIRIGPDPGGDGPRVRVAAPATLRLAKSGVASLMGPNGVGKSVVLAAATGILDLAQIEIVRSAPLESPPLLASQYPETEIFEESARDEVTYAAVARGVPRERAIEKALMLLDRMGVDGEALLAQRVWDLSGGQKRILSLAGAMVAPASLLALDEPTAGLDRDRRLALAGIVGEIARERSVLVASQDVPFLDALGGARIDLDRTNSLRAPSASQKTD